MFPPIFSRVIISSWAYDESFEPSLGELNCGYWQFRQVYSDAATSPWQALLDSDESVFSLQQYLMSIGCNPDLEKLGRSSRILEDSDLKYQYRLSYAIDGEDDLVYLSVYEDE